MKSETKAQMKAIDSTFSKMNRIYIKWAQRRGVNSYIVRFLYALSIDGFITQRHYIEENQIPKQTVNNVIMLLKKDGYISMNTNEVDRREKIISLTEKGRVFSEELLNPLFQIEKAVVEDMGEECMRQLIKLIVTFGDLLEQKIEQAKDNYSTSVL